VGALKGSASYLRFLIEGEAPKNPGKVYEEAIEARRFLPLHADAETLEQAGWVPTESPFADDVPITRDLFLFGELVAITYREDKYVVPRAILAKRTAERLAKVEAEEDDGAKKVKSRSFRRAVEAAVLVELKRQTYPRNKLVDVIWDLRRGEARVFGRGAVAKERCIALFERTFGVRAVLGAYAARAFSIDMPDRAKSVLEQLKPGPLFPDEIDVPSPQRGVA
jgi:hypothetical protein